MRAVSATASGVRHIVGVSLQAFLILAIIATLLLALSPVYKPAGFLAGTGAAQAGRASYSPTLQVIWPESLSALDASGDPTPYRVSGCGFNAAYGGVTIVVTSPESISFSGGMPNADGCISVGTWYTQGGGHYDIDAFQQVPRKSTRVASTEFDL
jgi:hypothetical protein